MGQKRDQETKKRWFCWRQANSIIRSVIFPLTLLEDGHCNQNQFNVTIGDWCTTVQVALVITKFCNQNKLKGDERSVLKCQLYKWFQQEIYNHSRNDSHFAQVLIHLVSNFELIH